MCEHCEAKPVFTKDSCGECVLNKGEMSPEDNPNLAEHFLWLEHDLAMDE
nr:MAG TPA: hypothetical protein [Caudoviricetes sp.]